MSKAVGYLYRHLLKPVLFLFDPEKVHDAFISLGWFLGRLSLTRFLVRLIFRYDDPIIETTVGGLKFKNPIGLSAGFDKNGKIIEIVPAVGFGFMEVGSVTAEPSVGNSKPRLWRRPIDKSLIVNYGLANDGASIIADRIKGRSRTNFVVGGNVAMTNCQENLVEEKAIEDYAKSFKILEPIVDYLTVNISCPNALGGKMFMEAEPLERLLTVLDKIPTSKNILLKLSPDIEGGKLDRLLDVAASHRVHGLVCSNLTREDGSVPGGLSGKAVFEKSNQLISHCYQKVGRRLFIIGCGGVMSAEDAYLKIKLGASLVQLVTGMIYEGPQLIGEINRGLARHLRVEGFASVTDAVGING